MAKPIETIATPWTSVILACRKCGKKLDGGFGADGKDTLPRALKAELRASGRRRSVRLIETKCLGLCPKNAVTLLEAGSPGRLLAVPTGTRAGALLARLLPQN